MKRIKDVGWEITGKINTILMKKLSIKRMKFNERLEDKVRFSSLRIHENLRFQFQVTRDIEKRTL